MDETLTMGFFILVIIGRELSWERRLAFICCKTYLRGERDELNLEGRKIALRALTTKDIKILGMKLKKASLFLLMAVALISCGSKSNEDKIKYSFNEYVKLNFGEPNKVKEITSIELTDSISTAEMKSDLRRALVACIGVKDLEDSLTKRRKYLIRKTPNEDLESNKDAMIGKQALYNHLILYSEEVDRIGNGSFYKFEIPKYISEYPDTAIYIYEIKFRCIGEDGKQKDNTYYAHANKSLTKIAFNEQNEIDDESLKAFVKKQNDIMRNWGEHKILINQMINENRIFLGIIDNITNN